MYVCMYFDRVKTLGLLTMAALGKDRYSGFHDNIVKSLSARVSSAGNLEMIQTSNKYYIRVTCRNMKINISMYYAYEDLIW